MNEKYTGQILYQIVYQIQEKKKKTGELETI